MIHGAAISSSLIPPNPKGNLMLKANLLTTAAIASTLTLSACSISDSAPATSSSSAVTSTKINGVDVTTPKGYTMAGQTQDTPTSTTTMYISSSGMPMYFHVASNATDFDMKKWCNEMSTSFKSNYASGAKVTQKTEANSCTIEGHGKTKNDGSTPSTSSTAPNGYTPKTVPGGTEVSNYATLTKTKKGVYVAMLDRHLGASDDFSISKGIFTKVAK